MTHTPLTGAQRQALVMAANGYSTCTAARELSTPVDIVGRQRTGAIEALGAETLAQAVARALTLGLIAEAEVE